MTSTGQQPETGPTEPLRPDSEEELRQLIPGYDESRPPPFIDMQGLWPDPETGPWYFRLFFGELKDQPECLGIELRSRTQKIAWNVNEEPSADVVLEASKGYSDFKSRKLGEATFSDPGVHHFHLRAVRKGWSPINLRRVTLEPAP